MTNLERIAATSFINMLKVTFNECVDHKEIVAFLQRRKIKYPSLDDDIVFWATTYLIIFFGEFANGNAKVRAGIWLYGRQNQWGSNFKWSPSGRKFRLFGVLYHVPKKLLKAKMPERVTNILLRAKSPKEDISTFGTMAGGDTGPV